MTLYSSMRLVILYSPVLDADKHSARDLHVRGREEILVNPNIENPVSDYDERFYRFIKDDDKVSDEFSFILDMIVSSPHMTNLNLFLCDTVVMRKGSPYYFVFNGESAKVEPSYQGNLRCITKANQLILPVLTTYFVKRRAMIYNREVKKEREFSNVSSILKATREDSKMSSYSKSRASIQKGTHGGDGRRMPMSLIELHEIEPASKNSPNNSRTLKKAAPPPPAQRESLNIFVQYFVYFRRNGGRSA